MPITHVGQVWPELAAVAVDPVADLAALDAHELLGAVDVGHAFGEALVPVAEVALDLMQRWRVSGVVLGGGDI